MRPYNKLLSSPDTSSRATNRNPVLPGDRREGRCDNNTHTRERRIPVYSENEKARAEEQAEPTEIQKEPSFARKYGPVEAVQPTLPPRNSDDGGSDEENVNQETAAEVQTEKEDMEHFLGAENMLTSSRDRPVIAIGITFPPSAAYHHYEMEYSWFGQGPWFLQGEIELGNIVQQYNIDSILPRNITVTWKDSSIWRRQ